MPYNSIILEQGIRIRFYEIVFKFYV